MTAEPSDRSDSKSASSAVDVPFSVPFVHRLRFTSDVFGADAATLVDLLESIPGQPARVQFWLDRIVAEAQPDLTQRIHALSRKYRDRLSLAGNVQIVPGGEEVKNDIHILERMLKVIHAHDLDRRSYVVVIGGGAMLDAVGFAAAIAHRGLRLIRLPTTTLGQADSGIGVKNAVNAFQKKELDRHVRRAVGGGERRSVAVDAARSRFPVRIRRSGESLAAQRSGVLWRFVPTCAANSQPRNGGLPRDDSPLGRVAFAAHHARRRSVRDAGSSAVGFRPLERP